MGGLSIGGFLLLGAVLLALFGLLTALVQALNAYSRSLLEEHCEALGQPERAAEVAREGPGTQRGSEALALLVALALVLSLSWAIAVHVPPPRRRLVAFGSVATAGLVHLLAVAFGRVYAEPLILRLWPITRWIRLLSWPWLAAERLVESRIRSSDPDAAPSLRPASVEVEIPHASEDTEGDLEAALPEITRERMENLVRLDQMTAQQVMTPRASLVMVADTLSVAEAVQVFLQSGYSRVPVFGESRDHIVGILYLKDLIPKIISGEGHVSVRTLAREPFWIPETKNAAELLDELRKKRVQIAIVLDEFGILTGLVTVEDLVEVVFGPIDDEYDVLTPEEFVSLGGGHFEVDGAMPLEQLNSLLHLKLPTEEEFQTVGGLAFDALGRIPQPGDHFHAHGIDFTVLDVVDNSIRRLRLALPGALELPEPAGG